MESTISRDQFLTHVCASRSFSSLSSSREDIIKKGGPESDGAGERIGKRKKIDLKKNPGSEDSRLRGSCVNFSEFP